MTNFIHIVFNKFRTDIIITENNKTFQYIDYQYFVKSYICKIFLFIVKNYGH